MLMVVLRSYEIANRPERAVLLFSRHEQHHSSTVVPQPRVTKSEIAPLHVRPTQCYINIQAPLPSESLPLPLSLSSPPLPAPKPPEALPALTGRGQPNKKAQGAIYLSEQRTFELPSKPSLSKTVFNEIHKLLL